MHEKRRREKKKGMGKGKGQGRERGNGGVMRVKTSLSIDAKQAALENWRGCHHDSHSDDDLNGDVATTMGLALTRSSYSQYNDLSTRGGIGEISVPSSCSMR